VLVDVHTHFLRGAHWGCEWVDHWQPVYGEPWPEITPEEFDDAMKGVDVAVVFGVRAFAVGVATPHQEVIRFCEQVQTATVPFMALDPADTDVLEQLSAGVALGMKGIKLYPVLSGFDATDPVQDTFYRAAVGAGLPILWHVGATPSPVGDLRLSLPMMIDDVARRHPDLVQIMAHLGHPWQRETITVLRKNRNVFADVSASWSRPFDGQQALVPRPENFCNRVTRWSCVLARSEPLSTPSANLQAHSWPDWIWPRYGEAHVKTLRIRQVAPRNGGLYHTGSGRACRVLWSRCDQ